MDHGARPGVHALCIQKNWLLALCSASLPFFSVPEILIGKMATQKLIQKLNWHQKKTADNHKRSCNNYQHLTETQVCSNTWRICWFQGDCKKVNYPTSAARWQYKAIHISHRNYKLTVIEPTVNLIFSTKQFKSSVSLQVSFEGKKFYPPIFFLYWPKPSRPLL